MSNIASPRPSIASVNSTRSPQMNSPSVTPTGSLRPSFDLPFGRSVSPAAGPNSRRNRAALRDYYNITTAPGAAARANSISSTISNVTTTADMPTEAGTDAPIAAQLDHPDFSPELYVQSLLKSSNLATVLRAESSLVSEIKNLDGERKALVYDNYSKLIVATETIGNMKKSMDERGGGALALTVTLGPAVRDVADRAERMVDRKDGVTREAVLQKQQKQKQLQTVRWVLEAPRRLRLLKEHDDNRAEKEWEKVSHLLDAWKDVKGVSKIRHACEQEMAFDEDEVDEEEEEEEQR